MQPQSMRLAPVTQILTQFIFMHYCAFFFCYIFPFLFCVQYSFQALPAHFLFLLRILRIFAFCAFCAFLYILCILRILRILCIFDPPPPLVARQHPRAWPARNFAADLTFSGAAPVSLPELLNDAGCSDVHPAMTAAMWGQFQEMERGHAPPRRLSAHLASHGAVSRLRPRT